MKISVCTGFILLLLAISCRFMLFTSCIRANKTAFRSEVLNHADHASVKRHSVPLCQLYVDNEGIEWVDHNKEVKLQGKFYEVLSVERTGDQALLLLIADDEETKLFDKFFRLKDEQKDDVITLTTLIFGLNFTEERTELVGHIPHAHAAYPGQCVAHYPEGHGSLTERPPGPSFFTL